MVLPASDTTTEYDIYKARIPDQIERIIALSSQDHSRFIGPTRFRSRFGFWVTHSKLSTDSKVAIGVGVGVGVSSALLATWMVKRGVWKLRKSK